MANITDANHGMEDVGTPSPCNDRYLHEPTLKEKTAKGLFWGGVSNSVQQVVGMVFGIAVARILSPDDYGLIAMLAIFTAIANAIMDSGFTTALINRKTVAHKDYNAVFWFSVFVSAAIYAILFFAAPLIASFFHQPVLKDLSRLVFLSFLFAGTGIAHNAFLAKKIMAKQRGIIDMAAVFVSGVVGLVLAIKGFAFWGLAVQQISQTFIAVLLRWHFSPWRPTFDFDFSPLKEMFGFSFKMLLTTIISIISANIFSIILGRYYGKTETGYYQQGYKWSALAVSVIAPMFTVVAQPVFVESSGEKGRQVNILRKMFRFGAFISFPLLLGLAFISREFILISVGEQWSGSIIFMQLFCVWNAFAFLWYLYTNLILSHNKSNIYLAGTVALAVAQLLVVYLMHKLHFGIVQMICAYISINFIVLLYWHFSAKKMLPIRIWHVLKDISPYLLAAVGAVFAAWFVTRGIGNMYLCILLKIAVVAVLYITVMWFSNSVIVRECYSFIKRRLT